MAPFGLATGWLLGRLARWRALLWALGPPLVLYAFHNWDLPVVACAVGAVYAVHAWRTARPLADRAVVAAVLLGLGFAFKLYPGAFVLPLALLVLTAPRARRAAGLARRGCAVPLAAGVTVVLVNLPFAVAGYEGWRASFTFQELRKVDITTNSIWYWGFRPYSEPTNAAFQAVVDRLSPTLVLLSFVAACGGGLVAVAARGQLPVDRRQRGDAVRVPAAAQGALAAVHAVAAAVLRAAAGAAGAGSSAYLVADLAMYVGIFRLFYLFNAGADAGISPGSPRRRSLIGVWGRAALLVALFVVFLRVPTRWSSTGCVRRPARAPAWRVRLPAADRPRRRPPGSPDRRPAASGVRRHGPVRVVDPADGRAPGPCRAAAPSARPRAISATTITSRATAVARNQSGGSPRADGPT